MGHSTLQICCPIGLSPSCHPAPPQALGRPASLRQVSRLVESVAGAGATSLRFSDFAQVGRWGPAYPGVLSVHTTVVQCSASAQFAATASLCN